MNSNLKNVFINDEIQFFKGMFDFLLQNFTLIENKKAFQYAEQCKAYKIKHFIYFEWKYSLQDSHENKKGIQRLKNFIYNLGIPIDYGHYPALGLSIYLKKYKFTKFLLNNRANVNVPEKQGFTPLMEAVLKENIDIIKLLIDRGADLYAKNDEGLNAIELAFKYGFEEIGFYLKYIAYDTNVITKKFTNGDKLFLNVTEENIKSNCCNICMEDYTESQNVVLLHGSKGAKHNMCKKCFSGLRKIECPFCRQKIKIKKPKYNTEFNFLSHRKIEINLKK